MKISVWHHWKSRSIPWKDHDNELMNQLKYLNLIIAATGMISRIALNDSKMIAKSTLRIENCSLTLCL